MKRIIRLNCMLLALMSSIALADEPERSGHWLDQIHIKGFGTAGIAHSNADRAQFVRDLSQPNGVSKGWSGKIDSILGIQANLAVSNLTEVVVQGITRHRFDDSWRPELTWAFIRHEIAPDFTVRLGRMGTEFYMQADSRLVGFANLTVRPPSDYYGPLVMSYFDGGDISLTIDTGKGLLRGKVFAGQAAENSPFVEPYTWNLHGATMLGGHLDYLNGPWQLRAGHAQILFNHEQPLNAVAGVDVTSLAPELAVVGHWARYDSLGIAYDEGQLQVHGQLSRIQYETSAYEDTRAGYLIAGYRMGQTTPYLGFSRVWSQPVTLSTPLPPPVASLIGQLTAQTHSDQHTLTLGNRWDFAQNLALKVQYDLIRGHKASIFPARNVMPDHDGRMNLFSLALDFIF